MGKTFNRLRATLMVAITAFFASMAGTADAETFLAMAEERGCIWCARWNEDVSTEYPKTAEGRAAPLRRFDISSPPEDIEFRSPVRFTPTFILVQDGIEVSRLEGYPGEDFFWGLLQRMLNEADIDFGETG